MNDPFGMVGEEGSSPALGRDRTERGPGAGGEAARMAAATAMTGHGDDSPRLKGCNDPVDSRWLDEGMVHRVDEDAVGAPRLGLVEPQEDRRQHPVPMPRVLDDGGILRKAALRFNPRGLVAEDGDNLRDAGAPEEARAAGEERRGSDAEEGLGAAHSVPFACGENESDYLHG